MPLLISQQVYHKPALLKSAVDYLNIKPGKLYVDATIGGGSHSLEILKKKGRVFGLDCDLDAVKHSQKAFSRVLQKCLPSKRF